MAYQFLHLDGYARQGSVQRRKTTDGRTVETRKWSARDIAAEAERDPDACPHVAQPQRPKVLFGCSPHEAATIAEQWSSASKDAQGRALRRDGLAMAAGVVSLPADRAKDWTLFREAAVHWLQQQYGERLRSVVEHQDERHPHLHFYAVPLPGERFEVLHPGRSAALKKAQEGAKKGAQNAAYKGAMQGWQDAFSNAVAARFGLVRLGPGKRRLTRAAWQAEKAQALALSGSSIKSEPALILSTKDVTKLVTKKRLLGDEYESSAELAGRLTRITQERSAPLRAQIVHAVAAGEQAERALLQAERDRARAKELEAELNGLKGLFTPEEIETRSAAHRARQEREEREWEALMGELVEAYRRIEPRVNPRRAREMVEMIYDAGGPAWDELERTLERLRAERQPGHLDGIEQDKALGIEDIRKRRDEPGFEPH